MPLSNDLLLLLNLSVCALTNCARPRLPTSRLHCASGKTLFGPLPSQWTIAPKVTHVILTLGVLTLPQSTRVPVVRASMEMGFIVMVSHFFNWFAPPLPPAFRRSFYEFHRLCPFSLSFIENHPHPFDSSKGHLITQHYIHNQNHAHSRPPLASTKLLPPN